MTNFFYIIHRTVLVDGKHIHKATIIRELDSASYQQISADRLRRCQGISSHPKASKNNTSESSEETENRSDDPMVVITGDPVALLCREEIHGQPTSICVVALRVKSVTGNTVSGTLMKLKSSSDKTKLVWDRDYQGKAVKTDTFQPLKMHFDIPTKTTMIHIDELSACLALSSGEVKDLPIIKSAIIPLSIPSLRKFDLTDLPAAAAATEVSKWSCAVCDVKIAKEKFRMHVGIHVLRAHLPSTVCGFCGKNENCTTSIERLTLMKNMSPVSDCPRYHKFYLKSAGKSTDNSPCTNRPVYCKADPCDGSVLLWTYDAERHMKEVHRSDVVPPEWVVSDAEKARMMKKRLGKKQ